MSNNNSIIHSVNEPEMAPHSVEAEESVLGSILFESSIMKEVAAMLKPDDFYILRNGFVFSNMLQLYNRREAIDERTLIDECKVSDLTRFKEIGGAAYITQLINSVAHYYNYWSYAQTILECSRRRRLLKAASDIATSAWKGSSDIVLEQLNKAAKEWSESLALKDDLRANLIHIDDLIKRPKATWLIEGEIPEIGLSIIYGPSGVGKSFFAFDIAMRLAQTHSVVYVAAEGSGGYGLRGAAWEKHHNLNGGKCNMYTDVVALIDVKEREVWKQSISHLKPKIIFVDTVASCLVPGNENDTRDMGLFVKACRELTKDFACAVVLVHHTGVEGQRMRGNTSLLGAAEMVIKLSGDDGLITIECAKSKDVAPFPTRYMKLLPVTLDDGTSSPCIVPSELITSRSEDPLTIQQEKILRTVHEVFPFGATPGDVTDTTGLNPNQVKRTLTRLVKFGFLEQSAVREPYLITESGKRKLGVSNTPTVREPDLPSSVSSSVSG